MPCSILLHIDSPRATRAMSHTATLARLRVSVFQTSSLFSTCVCAAFVCQSSSACIQHMTRQCLNIAAEAPHASHEQSVNHMHHRVVDADALSPLCSDVQGGRLPGQHAAGQVPVPHCAHVPHVLPGWP